MTDRELMQMALDALNSKYIVNCGAWQVQRDQAIDALRARLAQPEPPYLKFSGTTHVVCQCDKCRAQPEPEPWGYISHKSWKMPVFVEADNLEVSGLPFNNPNYTPVYKAPPQREWQGLTDEEVIKLGRLDKDSDYFGLWYDFARAIEAKLKEKNA